MRFATIACLLFVLLAAARTAQAQTGAPAPERVSVLTMGPGDHPFARFGHNALLVEGPGRRALVYNFGTFAFDGLQGVEDFMAGRFRYWLSVSTLARTERFYRSQDRSMVAQELNLSALERAELGRALEVNAQPDNRFYDYDYYYDNCSTRVRDVVARTLGGELERSLQGPGRFSFREHTERLTADAPWLYFGLDLALGPLTDRPITRWEELFIPDELHAALGNATRVKDGRVAPVVQAERVLLTSARPPSRSAPPSRVPVFAALGLGLGAVLAVLGRLGRHSRTARIAYGLCAALIGLLGGLLGTIFGVFWLFTKHWAAYRNFNLLVCPPWALLLVVTGIGLALGRPRATRLSQRLLAWSAVTSLAAILFALTPGFGQDNTRTAALLAPLWLGLYAGSAWLTGTRLVPFLRHRRELGGRADAHEGKVAG